MENFALPITTEALKGFTAYDEMAKRVIPTAHATLASLSFGTHPSFFSDDSMNMMNPLRTKTATYDLLCDPKDREAIVEAIAKGFDGQWFKLFSIEMISTTKTKWSPRKSTAITRESHHQPQLVITWSEDLRVIPKIF